MTEHVGPLVSIGLPVLNGEGFVHRAIESLLAQTHRRIELVISENASDDGTYEVCAAYAGEDARVRIIRQTQRVVVTENFDAVLHAARGEYFMFAAADDWWHPTFVEALLEELNRRPEAGVAMSAFDHSRAGSDEKIEVVRFNGADDPRTMGNVRRAMRQAGGKAPYFQYIYGLFRKPFLDLAYPGLPVAVSSDGLLAMQLALATEWGYVDQVLTTRHLRDIPWEMRYADDALAHRLRDPWAEVRLLLVAGPYLARSVVIPWRRKVWIPVLLVRLARWRIPIWLSIVRTRLRPGGAGDSRMA